MAVQTPISAVTIAAGAKSTATVLGTPLTAPCSGVSIIVTDTRSALSGGRTGLTLQIERSLDGTIFSDPVPVLLQTTPNAANLTSSVFAFIEAKNCVNVRFTLTNVDVTQPSTATLKAIQV